MSEARVGVQNGLHVIVGEGEAALRRVRARSSMVGVRTSGLRPSCLMRNEAS
jgi:hypothetical protein